MEPSFYRVRMDWVHSTISIWATIQTISHAKARPQGLEQRSVMLQTVGSEFYIYIYIYGLILPFLLFIDLILFLLPSSSLIYRGSFLPQFSVGLHFLAISLEQKKFMPM